MSSELAIATVRRLECRCIRIGLGTGRGREGAAVSGLRQQVARLTHAQFTGGTRAGACLARVGLPTLTPEELKRQQMAGGADVVIAGDRQVAPRPLMGGKVSVAPERLQTGRVHQPIRVGGRSAAIETGARIPMRASGT